ncbi:MAG: type II toxin-antitoxin system VapC family toxin [Candidatus Dormibacteraceae bacterium]
MLVVDASVVVTACNTPAGFVALGKEELISPPLMWSEVRSTLHEACWRHQVSPEQANKAFSELGKIPVRCCSPEQLGFAAWKIADNLGWAKTYDAEYVALAQIFDCQLITLDARLRRGADRLGVVISLSEWYSQLEDKFP